MRPPAVTRLLSLALVGALACTSRPDEAPATRAQRAISDELHQQGTAGFLFLPPMVPRPARLGDLVTDASPVVRVDEITPAGVTLRTLATFTTDSGPSRERVRLHVSGSPCDADDDDGDDDPEGYFLARWHTNNARLSTSATYRVRVLVPARGGGLRELGFADVDVVRNEREFRSVDRAEFTPLVNGRTLRIKFRIDRPAVDRDRDGVLDWRDNCPAAANPDQRDTLRNGIGDACRCAGVTCAPADACHLAAACEPATGTCARPAAPDGTACPLDGAAGRCQGGVCTRAACEPGRGDCDGDAANGCEADLSTAARCGACNVACPAPGPHAAAACLAGACGLTCEAGWADCDGAAANGCEVNTSVDGANCGACGAACTAGRTCVAGACSATVCAAGTANCDGAEANGCEVALATDAGHCGACNVRCAFPHAAATCAAGACVLGACDAGFADCDGAAANGCEADLRADAAHCGACGTACAFPGAVGVCAAGACALGACAAGRADCDGVAGNGCEVALDDVGHCGACGAACVVPHATPTCAAGACGVGACAAGWADCDGAAGNGCEADLGAVASCGACGRACGAGPHAAATCGAGACVLACEAGWANCDGVAANGCEVDTSIDGANCGACGAACTAGRTCVAGACSATACAAGTANCDGAEANGCEVALATDASHCGACGNACSFPHAAGECAAGACGFSVCEAGYGDCDGAAANGCEVSLRAEGNCGGCGVSCDDYDDCTADACGADGRCAHTVISSQLRCVACTGDGACGAGGVCAGGRCCAGGLALGGAVTLTVPTAGEAATTFCASAGDRVILRLTSVTGSHTVTARVIDPSGNGVSFVSGSFSGLPADVVLDPLHRSGVYRVVLVNATTVTAARAVQVALAALPPPIVPLTVASDATAVPLTLGLGQRGEIRFDAAAGQRVTVGFLDGGSGAPSATLYGPSGAALGATPASQFAGYWGIRPVRVVEGGTHVVRVAPRVGTFLVYVATHEEVTRDLVVDGPAVTAGAAALQGASFRFEAAAGQRVWLRGTGHGGDVTLVSPSGRTLPLSATPVGLQSAPVYLTESGRHALRVAERSGTFTFQVAGHAFDCTSSCDDFDPCTADACDAATGCVHAPLAACPACADDTACDAGSRCIAGRCRAVDLTPGASLTRTLPTTGNTEVTFYAVAGERLALRVANAAGTSLVRVEVLGPEGTFVASQVLSSAPVDALLAPAPVTGVYRAVLSNLSAAAGRAVTLSLSTLGPEVVQATTAVDALAVPLTLGAGQRGELRFTGAAGRRVALYFVSASGLPTLTLSSPDGVPLGRGGAFDVVGPIRLGADGVYVAHIADAVGPQTVAVVEVPEDIAAPLTRDGSATAATPRPFQVANLTFDAVAGQRVGLIGSFSSIESGSSATLVSPSGASLILATTLATVRPMGPIALTETGAYTVRVAGVTHPFTMKLESVPPDRSALASPNGPAASLSAASSFHDLRFTVPVATGQPTTVTLRVNRTTSVTLNGASVFVVAGTPRTIDSFLASAPGERSYVIVGAAPDTVYTVAATSP